MKQKNVVLMVVAVGCGLVAAFLTSQMSAKGKVETVDVVVAKKDIPVGTTITRDEAPNLLEYKKMPKDGLPPAYVGTIEELYDKRLSRPVRAKETFNPQDLVKGGAIMLPPGHNMVSMSVGVSQAAAGFVGPGSRVNVLATVRLDNKMHAFPLLVNMLVIAVNSTTVYENGNNGAFPNLSMVSFAVKGKESLLLSLAKTRGCALELELRHPDAATDETNEKRVEENIKLLTGDKEEVGIKGASPSDVKSPEDNKPKNPQGTPAETPKETPKPDLKPETPVAPYPTPKVVTVQVLVATKDIAAGTDVTSDLLADSFEMKEYPIGVATDALNDLKPALGKVFKFGVAKGQWVTGNMVGLPGLKPSPQDTFTPPKPGPVANADPVRPDPKVEPKTDVKPPVQKKYHDVAVHDAKGTVIWRYEEVGPGKWKKVAELTPEQAAEADKPAPPKPATPDATKKAD
ncbi:MAG: Flp pilus assembly protein CpaB [Planctomycetes bacterium]|nr:Flp pilus assembly protein CpaB [Planctomycetota bacterium]